MKFSKRFQSGARIAGLAVIATLMPADGNAGKRAEYSRAAVITACSTNGHGCTSAPTRRGKWGLEMRLKGGTWIDCESDCEDTLRRQTVDFWDTLRETGGSGGGN